MKAELDFATWGPADYVRLPHIPDHWKCLDVGTGTHPWRRADVYADWDARMLQPLLADGKTTVLSDIRTGFPMFADKQFDFVWCSHVLEHVLELPEACATLSRIAKRGTIVLPSFAKEALFHFEDPDHVWNVLPNPTHGEPPIFVERNVGFTNRLRDQLCQKATSFLYRTGSQHECTAERHLRFWYQEHEKDLDIVYHWEGELKVVAIR